MIHVPIEPRRRALTLATGALLLGLGVAGAAGALTVGAHRGPAVAPPEASGYIVCVAYGQQWGVCIGPPTN